MKSDAAESSKGRIAEAGPNGHEVQILVDGQAVSAFEGETIAAALLAAGKRGLRRTTRWNQPRGVYCSVGLCFECVMIVDGQPNTRTCQTPVHDAMRIESQTGEGTWGLKG